jgi:hypothetical protein
VLDEHWPALAVRVDERLHDPEARAHGVSILSVAGPRPVRDDAVDVPLVRVEEEADEGLLVVGVTAGVRLDDEPRARGRVAPPCAGV